MHQKLELKTHTAAVALTTAWPMVAALVIVAVFSAVFLPLLAALRCTMWMRPRVW